MTTINKADKYKDILMAYADCHMDGEAGMKLRNLHFRSADWLTIEEAVEVMTMALGGGDDSGYNEFTPELLNKLPADSRVQMAREGSVCAYVKTNFALDEEFRQSISADELDADSKNSYRIWWD